MYLYENEQQTGRQPVVLGRRRRKRSLLSVRPLTLNLGKQRVSAANNKVYAQANKTASASGATGNLSFALNKPASAYIWSNPLVRVFKGGSAPNKQLYWQFNKGYGQQSTSGGSATAAASTNSLSASPPASPAGGSGGGAGGGAASGGARPAQAAPTGPSTARPANPPAG